MTFKDLAHTSVGQLHCCDINLTIFFILYVYYALEWHNIFCPLVVFLTWWENQILRHFSQSLIPCAQLLLFYNFAPSYQKFGGQKIQTLEFLNTNCLKLIFQLFSNYVQQMHGMRLNWMNMGIWYVPTIKMWAKKLHNFEFFRM